jgi:hypothetical protein
MVAPRIILRQPTHCVAFWQNVVIAKIEGHVDAQGVRGMVDSYGKLYETYPRGIVGLTVLSTSLKVGSSDTNAEAKRGMLELRGKLLHVAIVIEEKGILASLLRAVIRTLNSVTRHSLLSLAADLDEAVRAVAPHVEVRDARSKQQIASELLEAVAAMRGAGSA